MITDGISIKEAAELYGLNAEYFRQNYCDDGGILARLGGLRVRRGKTGKKRSIEVSKAVILALKDQESHQGVAA